MKQQLETVHEQGRGMPFKKGIEIKSVRDTGPGTWEMVVCNQSLRMLCRPNILKKE